MSLKSAKEYAYNKVRDGLIDSQRQEIEDLFERINNAELGITATIGYVNASYLDEIISEEPSFLEEVNDFFAVLKSEYPNFNPPVYELKDFNNSLLRKMPIELFIEEYAESAIIEPEVDEITDDPYYDFLIEDFIN